MLATREARHWHDVLDDAGVPCEIASATYARELFDDAAMYERGWVARSAHADLGMVEHVAMPFSFSVSSRPNLAGAPVTGQHSRAVLAGLGYSESQIDELVADGVVLERAAVGAGSG